MPSLRPFGAGIPRGLVDYLINRSNMQCERCDAPHINEPYQGLQVHHKDENRKHNVISNLIVLCRSCHWKIHTRDFKGASNPMYGKVHSMDAKIKQSIAAKNKYASGVVHPMKGRKHTARTRRKISETRLQRIKDGLICWN